MPQINQLLTEPDNAETVRDQVAAILRQEWSNQEALARAAGVDPEPWRVSVYAERSGAFERGLNSPVSKRPVVNVWLDNQTWDRAASNIYQRQRTSAYVNIDAIGYGTRKQGEAGDYEAATACQRVMGVCRQILMAAPYTWLGMRGVVAQRWPQSLTYYQPSIDERPVQHAYGARLTLVVDFNEFSPQTVPESLEYLAVQVKRAETGEVYFDAHYDYEATP